MLDTSDSNKARSFLDAQAKLAGAHAAQLPRYRLPHDDRRRRLRSRRPPRGDRQRLGLAQRRSTRRAAARRSAAQRILQAAREGPRGSARARLLPRRRRAHAPAPRKGSRACSRCSPGGHARERLARPLGGLAARSTPTRSPPAPAAQPAGCSQPTRRQRRGSANSRGESWLAIGLGHLASDAPRRRQGARRRWPR